MLLLKTCVRGAGSARFWRYRHKSLEISSSSSAGVFPAVRRAPFSSTLFRVRSDRSLQAAHEQHPPGEVSP